MSLLLKGLTYISQTPALDVKLSQCILQMQHNAMLSLALHSATQYRYIHMTRHRLHKFTQCPWLQNNMRQVEPHAMSAYDMHLSLHMKQLVILPIQQVIPLNYHKFLPRLSTFSHRAKHSYMLHTTLRRVMMLSQQPMALSTSTWFVVSTNISALTLLVCVKVVNRSYGLRNRLYLLSKVSIPKLREWRTNCLRKNPY